VSSERDNRARAAARARLERQMAARREAHRRRRVLQGRIAAGVAGMLVLGAIVWIAVAALSGGEQATPQGS
jgi:peptidyl-prolyl cis-trans isomerase B (cyclophilin B)